MRAIDKGGEANFLPSISSGSQHCHVQRAGQRRLGPGQWGVDRQTDTPVTEAFINQQMDLVARIRALLLSALGGRGKGLSRVSPCLALPDHNGCFMLIFYELPNREREREREREKRLGKKEKKPSENRARTSLALYVRVRTRLTRVLLLLPILRMRTHVQYSGL